MRTAQICVYEQRAAAKLRECDRKLGAQLRASFLGARAQEGKDTRAAAATGAHQQLGTQAAQSLTALMVRLVCEDELFARKDALARPQRNFAAGGTAAKGLFHNTAPGIALLSSNIVERLVELTLRDEPRVQRCFREAYLQALGRFADAGDGLVGQSEEQNQG